MAGPSGNQNFLRANTVGAESCLSYILNLPTDQAWGTPAIEMIFSSAANPPTLSHIHLE